MKSVKTSAPLVPNFFIIGAGKSGTTSLWWYLHQHPQIFLSPIKEPRYFSFPNGAPQYRGPGDEQKWNRQVVADWERYQALFSGRTTQSAVGEASNAYLYFAETTAPRIASALPHARCLAVLRHPADRAYSNFLMLRGEGREPIADFRQACALESKRMARGWSPDWAYFGRSRYADAIQVYQRVFPGSQSHFFLYDDLLVDPLRMIREVCEFLAVEPFTPDMRERYNISTLTSIRWLAFTLRHQTAANRAMKRILPSFLRHRLQRILLRFNASKPPRLPVEVRAEVTQIFREDILRISDLIHRDLTNWLEPTVADS
jgi:hypothetical protein